MKFKKTLNKPDYKVWVGTNGNTVTVFKNSYTTPTGRRYILKTHGEALKKAQSYMKRN